MKYHQIETVPELSLNDTLLLHCLHYFYVDQKSLVYKITEKKYGLKAKVFIWEYWLLQPP